MWERVEENISKRNGRYAVYLSYNVSCKRVQLRATAATLEEAREIRSQFQKEKAVSKQNHLYSREVPGGCAGIYDEGWGRLRYLAYIKGVPIGWYETQRAAINALADEIVKISENQE